MIFGLYTRKDLEREIDQRLHEEYIRRQLQENIDELGKHVAQLDGDLFDLRMRVEQKEMPKCQCGEDRG